MYNDLDVLRMWMRRENTSRYQNAQASGNRKRSANQISPRAWQARAIWRIQDRSVPSRRSGLRDSLLDLEPRKRSEGIWKFLGHTPQEDDCTSHSRLRKCLWKRARWHGARSSLRPASMRQSRASGSSDTRGECATWFRAWGVQDWQSQRSQDALPQGASLLRRQSLHRADGRYSPLSYLSRSHAKQVDRLPCSLTRRLPSRLNLAWKGVAVPAMRAVGV